jgi:lipopolysaccharide/colanic/teichoic acid biosynthesis glycosyltransferase
MKPRVVHVTTVDMSVRHLLLNQLLQLRDAGFEVAAMSAPGPDLDPVAKAGVPHFAIPFTRQLTPIADLRSFWRLWRTFRRERFTIVHTHQAKAALFGQMAARLAGGPIVVNTLHGFYFHDRTPRLKRRAWILLERFQALLSDRILSQNSEDIRTAVDEGICSRNRIAFVGNGIDLTRFDPDRVPADARRRLRASLGFADSARVVGFVGRLVREKGILELLDAFRRVRERVPDARLLIVGPVDEVKADAVKPATAAQHGVEDAVFLGYRHDMPELYAIMDVCVLPSHREGFPRSPMEAAAMGVPCVATDIRGCREVVKPGVNGLLVPVLDPASLADAIATIVADPPLAARLGAAGREMAAQSFDERQVAGRVVDAYRQLLERKGRRAAHPLKRAFDIAAAGALLVLLSPLMLAVALAVRVKLGSPVLFRQRRPGVNGAPFVLLKFRTMSAAVDGRGVLLPDADRITPLGRLLRRLSIDELPELVNVLRGDMSLVGPRPLLMAYLERYTREQARRHEVRPGITGLAQVSGRNLLSWEDRFACDVWYVDHWSFGLDLTILARTVWTVLARHGINQPGSATAEEFKGSV